MQPQLDIQAKSRGIFKVRLKVCDDNRQTVTQIGCVSWATKQEQQEEYENLSLELGSHPNRLRVYAELLDECGERSLQSKCVGLKTCEALLGDSIPNLISEGRAKHGEAEYGVQGTGVDIPALVVASAPLIILCVITYWLYHQA